MELLPYLILLILCAMISSTPVPPEDGTSTQKREGKGFLGFTFFAPPARVEPNQCIATNGLLTIGTCYNKQSCTEIGGVDSGTCPSGGVCCVIPAVCGGVVARNRTWFVNKDFPGKSRDSGSCTLTITKEIPRIKQARLDFYSLQLEGARKGRCLDDTFSVTATKNVNGREEETQAIPSLCGDNTGQHVYVDLEKGDAKIQVNLNAVHNAQREWRVLITQLDSSNTAPPDCLQYHREQSLEIVSLNYDASDSFRDDLNYDICFTKLERSSREDSCKRIFRNVEIEQSESYREGNGRRRKLKRNKQNRMSRSTKSRELLAQLPSVQSVDEKDMSQAIFDVIGQISRPSERINIEQASVQNPQIKQSNTNRSNGKTELNQGEKETRTDEGDEPILPILYSAGNEAVISQIQKVVLQLQQEQNLGLSADPFGFGGDFFGGDQLGVAASNRNNNEESVIFDDETEESVTLTTPLFFNYDTDSNEVTETSIEVSEIPELQSTTTKPDAPEIDPMIMAMTSQGIENSVNSVSNIVNQFLTGIITVTTNTPDSTADNEEVEGLITETTLLPNMEVEEEIEIDTTADSDKMSNFTDIDNYQKDKDQISNNSPDTGIITTILDLVTESYDETSTILSNEDHEQIGLEIASEVEGTQAEITVIDPESVKLHGDLIIKADPVNGIKSNNDMIENNKVGVIIESTLEASPEKIVSKEVTTESAFKESSEDNFAMEFTTESASEPSSEGNVANEVTTESALKASPEDNVATEITTESTLEPSSEGNAAKEVTTESALEDSPKDNVEKEVTTESALEPSSESNVAMEVTTESALEPSGEGNVANEVITESIMEPSSAFEVKTESTLEVSSEGNVFVEIATESPSKTSSAAFDIIMETSSEAFDKVNAVMEVTTEGISNTSTLSSTTVNTVNVDNNVDTSNPSASLPDNIDTLQPQFSTNSKDEIQWLILEGESGENVNYEDETVVLPPEVVISSDLGFGVNNEKQSSLSTNQNDENTNEITEENNENNELESEVNNEVTAASTKPQSNEINASTPLPENHKDSSQDGDGIKSTAIESVTSLPSNNLPGDKNDLSKDSSVSQMVDSMLGTESVNMDETADGAVETGNIMVEADSTGFTNLQSNITKDKETIQETETEKINELEYNVAKRPDVATDMDSGNMTDVENENMNEMPSSTIEGGPEILTDNMELANELKINYASSEAVSDSIEMLEFEEKEEEIFEVSETEGNKGQLETMFTDIDFTNVVTEDITNVVTEDIIRNAVTEDITTNVVTEDIITNVVTEDITTNVVTEDSITNVVTEDTITNDVTENANIKVVTEDTKKTAAVTESTTTPKVVSISVEEHTEANTDETLISINTMLVQSNSSDTEESELQEEPEDDTIILPDLLFPSDEEYCGGAFLKVREDVICGQDLRSELIGDDIEDERFEDIERISVRSMENARQSIQFKLQYETDCPEMRVVITTKKPPVRKTVTLLQYLLGWYR